MQKEERFGGMCAWGYQASWSLIEGVGGERYVAGDLGLDPGTRALIAGSWQQPGLCRSLSLIDSECRPADAGWGPSQEKSSSVLVDSRRQSRCQGSG